MEKIEWIAIIQEQQASGMSMKEFCNDRNISYSLFKNHKYSLKKKGTLPSPTCFVPLRQETAQSITFTLNGNTLSFDASLSQETITKIVKALIS